MTNSAANSDTSRPFDDIRALASGMPVPDADIQADLKAIIGPAADPLRCVGTMQNSMGWLAGWQGRTQVAIERPLVAVFIGSHGIAQRVLNADPIAGAKARVDLMTKGPAGVRAAAAAYGAAFKVFEMGIEYPSADFSQDASLSERDCAAAIAFGMEVVAEGADVLILGNAGFGSATAAAAITRGLYGGQTAYWAGGNPQTAPRRIEAVNAGFKTHSGHLGDPLEVLRRFGGRDIAGMVGAILAAGHQRIPVILDGFVVCAAAAILHKTNPAAIAHCRAGHLSAEPAHGALLDQLGLTPLLNLGIGVGDGTGATLAMGGLKAAAAITRTMVDDS